VPGVNAGIGLTLELPLNNTAQLAERDVKRAQHAQAAIAARDLERQIPLAVLSAVDDLRLSKEALESSVDAVNEFAQAVSDQRDKLREGAGTVIDMVLTEELLIAAQQGRTANQLRCAAALSRVLLEIGALPARENTAASAIARLLTP
jgi:outer membrane protein TolC